MRTVLITGASGGIGEAAARAFARAGYRVVLHCFSGLEKAEALSRELPGSVVYRADLRDPAQVRALAEAFPETDVLVNNAAVDLFSLFDWVPEEQARALYEVNLQSGCILNVSSVFGETGGSCEVDYSAAKAGLIGFTKALAKEVGPAGVRVNCVCPGVIRTRMNDRLTVEEAEELADSIPLERFGTPEEVASALVFLASEEASYITGAILDVNGGL